MGEALLMVVAATALGRGAAGWLPVGAADLLYLVPVIAAASLFGRAAGLVAAVVAAAAYDFFWTAPLYSFAVRDPADLVTVAVLLGVALATSGLAARARRQADLAAARAALNAALARFAQGIAAAADGTALAEAIAVGAGRVFGCDAVVVDPDARLLAPSPGHRLDALATEAARATMARSLPAGRGTSEPLGSDWTFFPIGEDGLAVAALGLARDDGRPPVALNERALLDGMIALAGLGFERQRLADGMAGVAALRERDRLRGALLQSVGHDLRTPLTAILAAAAELRAGGASALVTTIEAEGRRLDHYIADLLDMARIEAGAIRLRTEAVDLLDAVAAAGLDVARELPPERLRIAVAPDLPLVRADARLLHHCLINLLDNAARHGAPGGGVRVEAGLEEGGLALRVVDEGPGLPPGAERRVWEQFARLEGSDRTGGTGLGLAIVAGFAAAMGVEASAQNRLDRSGAVFRLRFPSALLVEPERDAA